jgi:hypothetical protein
VAAAADLSNLCTEGLLNNQPAQSSGSGSGSGMFSCIRPSVHFRGSGHGTTRRHRFRGVKSVLGMSLGAELRENTTSH